MKYLRYVFCVFPFVITIIILILFQQNKPNLQNTKNAPKEEIKFENKDQKEFEKWHISILQKLDRIEKDQILVKKDMKVFGPNDLNVNKKLIVKLMFLAKCKRETEEFLKINKSENIDTLKNLTNKIDNLISDNKQKLYNNNRNPSLLDKSFLDNLNVYIQH